METKKAIYNCNEDLVLDINSVLFMHDFAGIGNIEHADEYQIEAIAFIYECKTKPINQTPIAYTAVLYRIFCDYFFVDILPEKSDSRWHQAGTQIFEILKNTSIK